MENNKIKRMLLFGEEACAIAQEFQGTDEELLKELEKSNVAYEIIEREYTKEEWEIYNKAMADCCGWNDWMEWDK